MLCPTKPVPRVVVYMYKPLRWLFAPPPPPHSTTVLAPPLHSTQAAIVRGALPAGRPPTPEKVRVAPPSSESAPPGQSFLSATKAGAPVVPVTMAAPASPVVASTGSAHTGAGSGDGVEVKLKPCVADADGCRVGVGIAARAAGVRRCRMSMHVRDGRFGTKAKAKSALLIQHKPVDESKSAPPQLGPYAMAAAWHRAAVG